MPVLRAGSLRILYIHIPRTGGSSVEELLRSYGTVSGVRFDDDRMGGLPCSPQHFHRDLLEAVYSCDRWDVRSDFDYVFATVREPFARLKSEFHYRTPWDLRSLASRATRRRVSFDRWVGYALARYKRNAFFMDNHLRPQLEFLCFGCQVFRLEDGLGPIVARLNQLTGMSGALPGAALNHRGRGKYDYDLSDRRKEMLAEVYGSDSRELGYGDLFGAQGEGC